MSISKSLAPLACGLAVLLSAPATAQSGAGSSADRLNGRMLARNATRDQINDAMNADAEALRMRDMAIYDRQVRRYHRQTLRNEARYHAQQIAYADAMREWRRQVRACHRGNTRACRAPSPTYDLYY